MMSPDTTGIDYYSASQGLGLLVDFDEQLGIKIEITELERSDINTPNKVIECLSKRG